MDTTNKRCCADDDAIEVFYSPLKKIINGSDHAGSGGCQASTMDAEKMQGGLVESGNRILEPIP